MRTLNTVTFTAPAAFFDIRQDECADAAAARAAVNTLSRPSRGRRAGALLAGTCLNLMLLAAVVGRSVPAPAPAAAAGPQPTALDPDHAI